MKRMNPKTKESLSLLIQSFLPLIAFYGVEHFLGLKKAIAATVVVTILEIIYRKVKKQELGAFFYFIAITTIGFGLIDVFSASTQFFKYEPAFTNLITGLYFVWGSIAPIPLILDFAIKAGKFPSDRVSEELKLYFRAMSWIWTVYFLLKAGVYYLIADEPETSTGKMMVIRTLAGNASMFIMLGISWLIGKPLFKWASLQVQKKMP